MDNLESSIETLYSTGIVDDSVYWIILINLAAEYKFSLFQKIYNLIDKHEHNIIAVLLYFVNTGQSAQIRFLFESILTDYEKNMMYKPLKCTNIFIQLFDYFKLDHMEDYLSKYLFKEILMKLDKGSLLADVDSYLKFTFERQDLVNAIEWNHVPHIMYIGKKCPKLLTEGLIKRIRRIGNKDLDALTYRAK